MSNPNKPAGGQPAKLPAEISAKRPGTLSMAVHIPSDFNLSEILAAGDAKRTGTLAMAVHIPSDFNPITEILAAADRCRDLARAADATDRTGMPTGKRPRPIEAAQVRDLNFALCLIAMRLSACTITIHREDASK